MCVDIPCHKIALLDVDTYILMVWQTLNNTSSFHCSSEFDHQDPLNVLAANEFETNSSNVMASSGAGLLYPL